MTRGRAALLAAAAAALVYLPALHNRFALDDVPVVEHNPAAHSVVAAVDAFGRPYWPPEAGAGQWRPLVILSFALDWQLSGGSPVWLHAVNILWHAAATALLVLVLAPFVSEAAALVGGLIFAVHPVHVEAVANLVGRAETMTACFLFVALLLGRVVRARRAAGRPGWGAEAGMLAAVAAALLTKEHAALAVALLALDDLALRARYPRALPWRDYAAVVALTVVWFLVRQPIDAGRSFALIAPTFTGLSFAGRAWTMLPVVFVLVRLMVWPFDLSPDYSPQLVPRLDHFRPLAAGGLVLLLALGALALVCWRAQQLPSGTASSGRWYSYRVLIERAALGLHRPRVGPGRARREDRLGGPPRRLLARRAISAGLLLIALAWLPTANLLFPTGVVIAERTLYLASAGLALIAAGLFEALGIRDGGRRAPRVAWGAAPVVLASFAVRTVTQIPMWYDNRDLILWELHTHPESYVYHETAARALVGLRHFPEAMSEYQQAIALFPLDHTTLDEAANLALKLGRWNEAREYVARSLTLTPADTVAQRLALRLRRPEAGARTPARAASPPPAPVPRHPER